MRTPSLTPAAVIWCLIITATNALGSVKLLVRDGRPIADGVYVNGHGPYRFLLDTGSNVDLIDAGLARKIGMTATFQVNLTSAAGSTAASGSDGNQVVLDSATAANQKFLFSSLEAIHHSSPDVRGVLGEWFLAQFDYTLNLRASLLDFGTRDLQGIHTPFHLVNGRPIISTSLGDLALDSGQVQLLLFGVQPDKSSVGQLLTVAGSQFVGKISGKPLLVSGRMISNGAAIAIPNRPEPGVDGLLPLGLFRTIYVCNSEQYVILN